MVASFYTLIFNIFMYIYTVYACVLVCVHTHVKTEVPKGKYRARKEGKNRELACILQNENKL